MCDPSRWIVQRSTERTIWHSADAMPEVAPVLATVLHEDGEEQNAREFVRSYLKQKRLNHLSDADIRPFEECGCCGRDFETRELHDAVILQLESGPIDAPAVEYYQYVSRVCPRCKRVAQAAVA